MSVKKFQMTRVFSALTFWFWKMKERQRTKCEKLNLGEIVETTAKS